MKPLYSKAEYDSTKSNDKLKCECYQCGEPFFTNKKYIKFKLSHHSNGKYNKMCKYCSKKCQTISLTKKIDVVCLNCFSIFKKLQSEIKRSPNHFCSKSCAGVYNNKHKSHGTRRSKLEEWIEGQLKILYPNLEILFNRKDVINSELDIYIPTLKLAFELNGIFHYEPIFSEEKLLKIKNNDNRKFQACLENNIELCVIDVSQLTYFKPNKVQKYLDIITNIINSKSKNV